MVVMMLAYYLWSDDFWNIEKALVIEYLLDVFPALRQSLWPPLHGLFVINLQLRELYSHAFNAGSIETFSS